MKKLLFSLFAIMAFVACTDSGSDDGGENSNNNQPKVPEITLDATAVNLATDGGSTVVTFTSSAAWTAEVINTRADAWCTVNPTSGAAGNAKITITTMANDTPDDRSASIIIKAETVSKTITVSQKQKDALTVTTSKFEVAAEGGEVSIEVKANIDFEYAIEESAKDWVEYKATRALETSNLVFDVKENELEERREAKITIKSGEFREVITIYQEGSKPSIILTQRKYTVPSAGQTIAVLVKSNVDVSVEMPEDAYWITENATRATSTNTYYFDINQNDSYENRTAEIKFTNKENKLSETITITQAQKDAIVIAENSYNIKGDGGEIEIEVNHNIEFDIKIDGNWITQKQTRALETSKLTFVVAENTTDKTREGSIIFTSKDGAISQKIIVTQGVPTYEITYTTSDGNIVTPYNISAFGANIISNVYENGKGVITFDGRITSIGNGAFYECAKLTSIAIPYSITSIGSSAFCKCSGLTNITIPYSITSIGDYAFSSCSGLTSVTIPNSVTSIGSSAFYNCRNLSSITLPDSIISIISGTFENCSSLTNITIPNSVTSIGGCAFLGCSSLTSVTIPDSVTSISNQAFERCSKLTSVTIGNSVTSIERQAFGDCDSLISFYGKFATADNRCLIIDGVLNSFAPAGLITYIIPDGVTSIGDGAFYNCNGLTSITIPDSVTEIGYNAFAFCDSLTSVTIPDSVTEIGSRAFYSCDSLTSVTIPNSVTSIGGSTFSFCLSLTSVTIPNSVTSIGGSTFSSCHSLTSVTIPNSVISIGNYAFEYCHQLASVIIPNSVTSIGDYAFRYCPNLASVTIPNSVTSIGKRAFYECLTLKNVYCKPATPPTLGSRAFDSNDYGRKIYVPDESVNAYKNADIWKQYANEIEGYEYGGSHISTLEDMKDNGTFDW